MDPEHLNLDDITLREGLAKELISENPRYVGLFSSFLDIEDLEHIKSRIVGSGKIGGKAAGLVLADRMLKIDGKSLDFPIHIPESWYIGSDVFINYLKNDRLSKYENAKRFSEAYPNEIHESFQRDAQGVPFPEEILKGIDAILLSTRGWPLAVRSSSLLEDQFGASFAGLYVSHFIPNVFDLETNRNMFLDAMLDIYASVWNTDALQYRRDHKKKELINAYEAMALLVQKVVGQQITVDGHPFFLPLMAGVAFSYDEEAVDRPDDGFITLGAGLGTVVVDYNEDHYIPNGNLSTGILELDQEDFRNEKHQKYVHLIDLSEKNIYDVVKSKNANSLIGGMAELEGAGQVFSRYYSQDDRILPASPFTLKNPEEYKIPFLNLNAFNKEWKDKFKEFINIIEFSYADDAIRKLLDEAKWIVAREVHPDCPDDIAELIKKDELIEVDIKGIRDHLDGKPDVESRILSELYRLVETKKVLESMEDYARFYKALESMQQKDLKMDIYRLLSQNAIDAEWAISNEKLYLVQARPLAVNEQEKLSKDISTIKPEETFFDLSHGTPHWEIKDVDYVIWVDGDRFYSSKENVYANGKKIINDLNRQYENERFILMLPGRAGSKDKNLGVGVNYADINNALAIIETPFHREIEFSKGSHFGVRLREKPIRYFHIKLADDWKKGLLSEEGRIVEQHLDGLVNVTRLPLDIYMDRPGRRIVAELKHGS